MNNSLRRVERLSNAACETATRNRNPSIGPDHLLYVICGTEQGRRRIEAKGGDYKQILTFLKSSFAARAQQEGEVVPDFTDQYHIVVSEPVMRFQTGHLDQIDVEDVLEILIERHLVCPFTTQALVRGNLVQEVDDSEQAAEEFDAQMREVSKSIAKTRSSDASADSDPDGDDEIEGDGNSQDEEVQNPQIQQDPHIAAVLRSLRNISRLAEEDRLDPVVGRLEEMDRILDVLQRRRKGNILLLGEPGVGKTAIVEGVAQMLALTDMPTSLASRPILEVSLTELISGTKFRGDFEQRIQHLINIAKNQRAILFIDEAHMLMGAGGTSAGSIDASNILKPALARGEIQIIAATTSAEARPIRKDKAMMRRFELLQVAEPCVDLSVEILRQVEQLYSEHHGISYDNGVARACVELAVDHMPDRRLPDKALDVLDTAAIEAKNAGASSVSEEFAVKAISSLTGVNVGRATLDELQAVREFPEKMAGGIFGQEKALEVLSRAVRISQTGVSTLGVAGTYLFNGPTGVGKTEAAKLMAKSLGIPLVRIDMSEYMEPHSISRLIGAPPGYVGYGEDGELISAAEAHPRMVLLLDEIEKAHSKVFDILLQVLDEGRLTSSDGRTVNMRGVHMIMTSNIGAKEAAKAPMGFGRSVDEEEVATDVIKLTFRKEMLARIAHVIHFEKLDDTAVSSMVNLSLSRMTQNLKRRGLEVKFDKNISKMITEKAMEENPTGRVVASLIDEHLSNAIAEFIVENEEAAGMTVKMVKGKVRVA